MTIPASVIVNVTPNVLAAGGSSLDLNGLILIDDVRVPIGTVGSFPTQAAVADYFGSSSQMASLASTYFSGFDNSSVKPGAMLATQYPTAAVSAYLRGGDLADMTLAQLQALSGTLSVVIDGVLKSASVNLSSATSFSNAASIIGLALGIHGVQAASIVGSIAGTTLAVSNVVSGALAAGDVLSGTGVVSGTYLTSVLASGTGGTVSPSQNMSSSAMTAFGPGVEYDSVSGAFIIHSGTTGAASTLAFGSGAMATSLKLTQITGAVLSQGAVAATPAAFMDDLIQVTQNWALFTTTFDPDAGAGTTQKLAFAGWTSDQNNRYGYVAWDTDASPTVSAPATSSFGYLNDQAQNSGTFPLWASDTTEGPLKAAFVLGIAGSIDFEELNGRSDFDFRAQAGLVADVTDVTSYANLLANHYNMYATLATANDAFTFLTDGSVSGDFRWMDSYVDQIWMNNAFQLALMTLLTSARSIPYNAAGNSLIEAALNDPINAAVSFGAIRAGVTLSASQIASVNADAGRRISDTLQNRGWYLQVLQASAAVRAARGSPDCKFWYTDGGSVHSIDLTSVELQ